MARTGTRRLGSWASDLACRSAGVPVWFAPKNFDVMAGKAGMMECLGVCLLA